VTDEVTAFNGRCGALKVGTVLLGIMEKVAPASTPPATPAVSVAVKGDAVNRKVNRSVVPGRADDFEYYDHIIVTSGDAETRVDRGPAALDRPTNILLIGDTDDAQAKNPVRVVDIYKHPAHDDIFIAFCWLYSVEDLELMTKNADMLATENVDRAKEVFEGTLVYTTPASFVTGTASLATTWAAMHESQATFLCLREYDERKKKLKPIPAAHQRDDDAYHLAALSFAEHPLRLETRYKRLPLLTERMTAVVSDGDLELVQLSSTSHGASRSGPFAGPAAYDAPVLRDDGHEHLVTAVRVGTEKPTKPDFEGVVAFLDNVEAFARAEHQISSRLQSARIRPNSSRFVGSRHPRSLLVRSRTGQASRLPDRARLRAPGSAHPPRGARAAQGGDGEDQGARARSRLPQRRPSNEALSTWREGRDQSRRARGAPGGGGPRLAPRGDRCSRRGL